MLSRACPWAHRGPVTRHRSVDSRIRQVAWLRAAQANPSPRDLLTRFLLALFNDLAHAIGSFASARGRNRQCKMYGHSFDQKGFSEEVPQCKDCGVRVFSLDELRGSVLPGSDADQHCYPIRFNPQAIRRRSHGHRQTVVESPGERQVLR